MKRLRVLVVEDSLTVRKQLVEVLSADPELEVVGEAEDGKRGIELCQDLRPDVVTVDMIMPVMTGLAATEFIMAYCPTPILIVSSSTNRGELYKTYDALAAGAVDVLDKEPGHEPTGAWERRLIGAVKLVAKIKVITHPRGRLGALGRATPAPPPLPVEPPQSAPSQLIALGVSTGGPGALVEILRHLPADFPLPVVLVLHIGAAFATAFADWLDSQVPPTVAFARDGEPFPGPGRVVIAPPDRHLVLRQGRLRLLDTPERNFCKPSVDVLFESLAAELGPRVTAALLTGMGRDGAEGLLALHRAGARTIAQDEASSVVYGMPREAVQLGAAERVLSLREIGPALYALAARRSS